jgi:hypothetical protein
MAHRVVGFAFGLLFAGLAGAVVWVWLDAPESTAGFGWVMLLAAVLGGLGIDAMVCALRDKRSLMSRIGPLP